MNRIVTFALEQRMLMILVTLFLFGAGIVSFTRLNIEAYPDPVPPRVEVITQSPGQSAEEMMNGASRPYLVWWTSAAGPAKARPTR